MQERWLKIKDCWQTLNLREQRVLLIGGIALVFFIIYLGIWSPLLAANENLRQKISSEQKTLVFLRAADKQLGGKDPAYATIGSPLQLLNFLQKQLAAFGLEKAVSQLKQGNHEEVELQLQQVEFAKFIRFLASLTQMGVKIKQLSATPDNTPGVVNVILRSGFK